MREVCAKQQWGRRVYRKIAGGCGGNRRIDLGRCISGRTADPPTADEWEDQMISKTFCLRLAKAVMCACLFSSLFHFGLTVQAQERIRIGISSLSPGFIPTIVAEKKGFYTKYGL